MVKSRQNKHLLTKITKTNRKRNKILVEIRKICKKNPKIKQKIKNIKNIDKKLYYAKVWLVTENQPLNILENSKERGWKNHHLDHIFPIALGYHTGLSPNKVGNIKNLRFIPYKENLNKGSKLTNESRNALKRIKRLKK
tara:strand:+ start:890 stop:1306 length:417 start_codon:yes stop_codon:yes gene_type:complete